MDTLRHGMSGYRMPVYIEEILTHNYCPCFVRMTIVRDGQSYRFSYRPGNMTRLDISSLDAYEKLVLLSSVMKLNDKAKGYLIGAEHYLLEPELIYSSGGSVLPGDIRILFYPDVKRLSFSKKLMLLTDRIRDRGNKYECEVFDKITELLDTGDLGRCRILLDKYIMRIESRMEARAG